MAVRRRPWGFGSEWLWFVWVKENLGRVTHGGLSQAGGHTVNIFPKDRNGLGQTLPFQDFEIRSRSFRWIPQTETVVLGRAQDFARSEIKKVQDEFIGMLGFDAVDRDHFSRKIFQVHCHDDVGAAADGSSQNVAVIRIGQVQTGNEILVADNKGVEGMPVHQIAGPFQLLAPEVRAVRQ